MGVPTPPSPLVPPPRPWALEAPQAPKTNPWPLMIAGGRVLGIILIFLGTLIAVVGASVPGSCYPGGCADFLTQAANSILAGKLLWVLGLFCLAGASGIRLQNGILPGSATASNDSGDMSVARMRANMLLLIISILLMALILLTINLLPPFSFLTLTP